MKKIALLGLVFAGGLLLPTREAVACSWCAEDAPRCESANYWKCTAYAKLLLCEQERADCAWAYNADEVGADGTLAVLASNAPEVEQTATEDALRGCHGLIVDRTPSPERVAEVRSETRRILL